MTTRRPLEVITCCSYGTPAQGHHANASQRWLRGVKALALVAIPLTVTAASNAAAANFNLPDIGILLLQPGETGMARTGF
jgi:hypothetical protein